MKPNMFFAHSGHRSDKADWQALRAHLIAVAELAGQFAAPCGLERAAYFAGLYHDLGKYSDEFQQRLLGKDIRVDHSTAGAIMLKDAAVTKLDKLIAELIAYCIAGHHAGLPDRLNAMPSCLDRRVEADLPALDPVWKTELDEEASSLFPVFATSFQPDRAGFSFSVLTRMIFSCLVDADFKDTEAFYVRLENRDIDRDWQPLQKLLPDFLIRFEAHVDARQKQESELNRLRGDTLAHVRAKAADGTGLFTLTVPTGGGKTLTSLGFALDHAHIHGQRRIIYAIPFTSIIDQTADIFRGILGEEHVLEHHSAIDEEKGSSQGGEGRQQQEKLKLAMEDWAAPVVVTTNVQFFESLFAARPSRTRKLHNIAGSVIILDEAQTIPRPLLKPCMRMLDELARHYGCTIVLCTATQPALDERKLDGGLELEGRELAPDPPALARKLRRATIRLEGEMSDAGLIDALKGETHGLAIVNSRKHALELYSEAKAAGVVGLIHLTTRQYAAHRREILGRVRTRLKADAPCRVIATSLIEAGVDIDFPKVWRAEAGLDQIVQAAGRCNREGRRRAEDSIVSIFSAPDHRPPREIEGLVKDMQQMLGRHDDLLSLDAIEDYFAEVYWRMGDRLDAHGILDMFTLSRRGSDFAFRTAAENFRMIESGRVPVIVAGDAVAAEAVKELSIAKMSSGAIARKLQPYIVQVNPQDRNLLIDNGHVSFVRPDLRGDQFALLQTASLYGKETGLLWEDGAYLPEESVVIS